MDRYYDRAVLDLYTDYLLCSFGPTTATGLSGLLEGHISHDRISRFLGSEAFTSKDLWALVKPCVRQVQSEDGVLLLDDTILEKPYTDENELVCWHWDHSKSRAAKGINLLSAVYVSPQHSDACLPVAFELVTKPDLVEDPKTGRPKRKARETKNERFRRLVRACVDNGLPFAYVLADCWYAAAESMRLIKTDLHRDFVMPIKSNRTLALSEADKAHGRWMPVSEVDLPLSVRLDERCMASATVPIWLEGVPFPLLLCKQVFTNEDGSQGVLYLVSSDTALTSERLTAIYHKRWKVEEYHKSVKSNASAEKSPTKTVATQTNHVFASLCAFIKLEQLRLLTHRNHFALKAQLYIKALQSAYQQLRILRNDCMLTHGPA